jgi:hypothetical protein
MDNKTDGGGSRQSVGIGSVLWPLSLVVLVVFRVVAHRHATAWDWVMIVVGGLFALLGLFAWRVGSPKRGAQKIDELNQQVYAGVHQRRIVDESTIRAYGLDMAFYVQKSEELGQLGFRWLNDIVIVELEQTWMKCRSVIRTFLSGDGTTMVGVYHARFGGFVGLLSKIGVMPRKIQVTDLETELSDRTFVTTSDAPMAGKSSEFPGISRSFLPAGTSTSDLWTAHCEHVREELEQKGGRVTPVILRTFEDLCASQDRLQLLKSRHRNSAAFDAGAEVIRHGNGEMTPEQVELAEEVARLHRERTGKI